MEFIFTIAILIVKVTYDWQIRLIIRYESLYAVPCGSNRADATEKMSGGVKRRRIE